MIKTQVWQIQPNGTANPPFRDLIATFESSIHLVNYLYWMRNKKKGTSITFEEIEVDENE